MFHTPSPTARQLWYYLRAVGRVEREPGFKHGHRGDEDGFLLHFIHRGELGYRIREKSYIARPGEACLLDVGNEATYCNAVRGKVKFDWALFHGKDMPRVFTELRADRSPLFTDLNAVEMKSLFKKLLAVTSKKPPAHDVRISAILMAILAELFACRSLPFSFVVGRSPAGSYSKAVRITIDRIITFYEQPLDVKGFAAYVHQSPSYFSRRFHQEVGMSPIAYLNQYRVEQAKQLLKASDKSIAEIARNVGLPDQNYFARVFTQIVGVSPRKHRIDQQKRKN